MKTLGVFNRKIYLILIILCIFLLIPSISAADSPTDISNDTVIDNSYSVSVDESSSLAVDGEDNCIYVSTTGSDDEGTGSADSPYGTISNALSNIDETHNTIIITEGSYIESGISISDNVSIIGQGNVVINGNNEGIIFSFTTTGTNVKIANLTLTNGAGQYGGAIGIGTSSSTNRPNVNLTIDSVRFINNTATGSSSYGGAIYISAGYSNVTVINSYFENNRATTSGGAIYATNRNILNVTNSTFINNAANYAGAIDLIGYSTSSYTITNSVFRNNQAISSYGYGGAIRVNGPTANIYSSVFDSNQNSGTSGGSAIYLASGYLNIFNSVIANNTSGSTSTPYIAIYTSSYYANRIVASNCWWGDNEGPTNKVSSGISVSTWVVMNATSQNGIIDVTLNTLNTGATLLDSSLLPARNVTFEGEVSNAKVETVNGIASTEYTAKQDGTVLVTIDNQQIEVFAESNNPKIYVNATGGLDTNDGTSWETAFSTLEQAFNSVSADDTAIFIANGVYELSNMITMNYNIFVYGENINDTIIDANNHVGFTVNTDKTVLMDSVTIVNASSSNYGGAIVNNGNLTITNSKFENNSAYGSGAIDNSGYLQVENSIFIGNVAISRDAGAVSNMGTATIINSTFINNTASRNGGAIKSQSSNGLTVVGSEFINNRITGVDGYGGALYSWDSDLKISDSVFINNTNDYMGGAVFTSSSYEYHNFDLESSVFINNNAYSGAAIYSNGVLTNASYSVFLNNGDNTVTILNSANSEINNNWWGNTQENILFNSSLVSGNTPSQYLILNMTSSAESAYQGDIIDINLDLTHTQDGLMIDGNLLPELPVTFTASNGTIDTELGVLSNGLFSLTYRVVDVGTGEVTAEIYNILDSVTIENIFYPNIIYVNVTGGSDDNDGTSWENAVQSISQALSILGDRKDTIYIAEGVYNENGLRINSDAIIQGFGNVIINATGASTIFTISNSDLTVSISNITFTGVLVGGFSQSAIVLSGLRSSLTIENSSFINNSYSGSFSYGSAIYQGATNSNLIINNSYFENNIGAWTGAVTTVSGTLTVTNSVFINNHATGTSAAWGGAIRLNGGSGTITNSIFYNNTADRGSAIYANVAGIIANYNIFEGNNGTVLHTTYTGNGNYNYFGTNDNPSSLVEGFTADYWTILTFTLNSTNIFDGDSVSINVDFTQYSDGNNLYDLEQSMPGINITLTPTLGNIEPVIVDLAGGSANLIYNAIVSGNENIIVTDYMNIANITFTVRDSEANTIYVSTTGNDNTGDGSRDNPYQTVDRAIEANRQSGGDKTIFLFDGVYETGNILISNNVTIIGQTCGNVIISSREEFIFNISSTVSITNLTLVNSTLAIDNNGRVNIIDSAFSGNDLGINNSNYLTITNSNFTDNNQSIASSNILIVNNGQFIDNDMAIETTDGEISVSNSLFENNANGSLTLTNSNVVLSQNTIINSEAITLENTTLNYVNLVFMENSTVNLIYGETPSLNVTVTDDNGNILNGGIITFTANGEIIGTSNVVNGYAVLNYASDVGRYLISGSYSESRNAEIQTGILNLFRYYWYIGDNGYETLQDAIDNANSGDIIEGISNVYYYTSPIVVNKNVTITAQNGATVVLDGSNNNGAIMEIRTGSIVYLVNITIANGYNRGNGAGIYNHGDLYIYNCIIRDNLGLDHADPDIMDYYRGGGLFIYDGSATIRNTTFLNNTAPFGGAIYVGGNSYLDVDNCTFIENSASTYNDGGGAIYNDGAVMLINNSVFIANNADEQHPTYIAGGTGGAIFSRESSNANIYNSIFINNTAYYWGGAIKGGINDLINCTFINNTARSGGALQGKFNLVSNSIFRENKATYRGGVLDGEGSGNHIYNSTFINNEGVEGGAIFLGFGADSIIENSIFINNTGENGGAIQNYHNDVDIINSIFINNTAINGGAFYNDESVYSGYNMTLNNLTFINNVAENGGAIYSTGNDVRADMEFTLTSSVFVNNTADIGSAIYGLNRATVNYNVFLNNSNIVIYGNASTPSYYSIQYNWWGVNNPNWAELISNINYPTIWAIYQLSGNPTVLSDREFSLITGSLVWNTDYSQDNIELIPTRTLILTSTGGQLAESVDLINGSGSTQFNSDSNGTFIITGTVDNQVLTLTINVNNFELLEEVYVNYTGGLDTNIGNSWNNAVKTIELALRLVQNGGTIYIADGTVYKSSQNPITIDKSVNIIGQSGEGTIINGNGSQIFIITNGNVTLSSLSLINGYNYNYGGAISNSANLTITDSIFRNNTAFGSGAIDNEGFLHIINSQFIDNEATGRDAGAVSNMGTAIIENSIFINNTAGRNGGALKNQGILLTVINSIFRDNVADDGASDSYGGAIYSWATDLIVNGSEFTNNSASSIGGAIFVQGRDPVNVEIESSIFDSNSANNGGALYLVNVEGSVSYSVFINNTNNAILRAYNEGFAIDNNWWGENNPNWDSLLEGISQPNSYAVLDITTNGNTIIGNLYWNGTTSQANIDKIPNRQAILTATSGEFENPDPSLINGQFSQELLNPLANSQVTVTVDNEVQTILLNVVLNTILTGEELSMIYHDGSRYSVVLTDINGNVLANQSIIFTVNGVDYERITDENGVASITINLNSGNYVISALFNGTQKYNRSITSNNITVNSTISGNDLVKYFRNETQYSAVFIDSEGNRLANTDVTFNINGVFYTRTTDENGVASLNINLNPGNYIITALNPETGEQFSNNIEVLSILIENSDLVKYFRNASQYTVKVLDNQGNPLVNEVVTFNINGVLYNRTTNNEGVATLNINLNPGNYIITAEYNGLRVSNDITVLSCIETTDLSMSFRDGSTFNALILDGQGQPLSDGIVTFNVNGVLYNRLTDSDGIARLNINLLAGEYIITSSFNGQNTSNKIIISD